MGNRLQTGTNRTTSVRFDDLIIALFWPAYGLKALGNGDISMTINDSVW
jgi:hypothetical protein